MGDIGQAQPISSLTQYYIGTLISENKGGPIWGIKKLPPTPICANLFPAKTCLLNRVGCARGESRQCVRWGAEEYS